MPKTIVVYGVQLTTEQEMAFGKYLSNNGIAMNTKTAEERTQIVIDWLCNLNTEL